MKRGVLNRGQVTVFIIIAILVVAGGGAGYYFFTKNSGSSNNDFFLREDIKPTMDNLRSSIVTCTEYSAKSSLEKIGIQGGYSDKPEKSFDLGWTFIPYYYYQGSFLMPDKTVIEKELGKEYEKEFLECFRGVNATGFDIKHGTSKTKASIQKGSVNFLIDMPVTISKEGNTMRIEMKDASVNENSKLSDIIEIGKYITDSHKADPNMICITCVADMAEEKDLYVYSFNAKDNSLLMLLMDNRTTSEPYYFEWLNKYNAGNNEEISSIPSPASTG
ncbi:Uncharacterised protein [uncultured archaeon]|nr:Uncharacterised protein [uncultured archaeon]